jgi:hypothetical protein
MNPTGRHDKKMTDEKEQKRGWGVPYGICILFAGLTAFFATAGAINVLAGGDWGFRIYGAEVDLPRHWEVVIPLYVVAGFVFLLGWVFGNVYVLGSKIKKHPLQVIAGTLLVVTMIVTSWTFWIRYSLEGGKLFWAIENHRMDIFKDALEADPAEDELVEAAYDAADEDQVEMLRLLLEKDITTDINTEERKRCLLSSCVGAGLEAGAGGRALVHKKGLESGKLLRGLADPRPDDHLPRALRIHGGRPAGGGPPAGRSRRRSILGFGIR